MDHEAVRTWWPIAAFVIFTIVQAILAYARVRSLEERFDKAQEEVKARFEEAQAAHRERLRAIKEHFEEMERREAEEVERARKIRHEGFARINALERFEATARDQLQMLMKRVFNGNRDRT